MTTKNALIGLWAHASIHAGAGSSVDGVDLPIQREGHSAWPCIFGSSVKGALRAKAEDKLGKDNASIAFVFGPDSSSDKASEHAGALLVSDAKLLLLPVRSLTSHFKWVTCPALLHRLVRDAQRLGLKSVQDITLPDIADDVALVAGQNAADLFLEEYRFKTQFHDLSGLTALIDKLTGVAQADLTEQLVIVSNNQFNYLAKYATPVTPHIAINNETKTVKPGALWYEETLPPETVLYFALSAQRCRAKDTDIKAEQILACVTQELFGDSPYLQVGGNETVGMGWCKVTVVEA
ncbi:MAG: type III-B CRISPR module RAMP protein Cmr4 [Methylococcaceae bacterium]|nr:MAG: type III-B CRISPR module RAMP protein Cmr4 [Methylococcaceae bacterium]